jgi:hypothetical protein
VPSKTNSSHLKNKPVEKLSQKEQAARTLKSYPTAKEVYFTSDG